MATQRLKSLCDDNDLFESAHSSNVLGQVTAGTIIDVEREPIYVADVKMFLVRPRGAVQYDPEWFSILPDEEKLVLPCGGLDDGFNMLTVDGVGQLSANSKESHARARSVVGTGEDSWSSDGNASRGTSEGQSPMIFGADKLDAARKRDEHCRVFVSAAQRQAGHSVSAKKIA